MKISEQLASEMHFSLEILQEIFKICKSSAGNARGNAVGNVVGNAAGNAAGNLVGNSCRKMLWDRQKGKKPI